jgi:hypothetical protein
MSEGKAHRILSSIELMDTATKTVVEMVEAVFHIEDLYQLSRTNSFIALNFSQLVTNIDYCIFCYLSHIAGASKEQNAGITPAGGTAILSEISSLMGIKQGEPLFENSPSGLLLSISNCFKIQSAKIDLMLDVNVFGTFMQTSGAALIARDAVNAVLGAGQTVVNAGTQIAAKTLPLAMAGA